MARSCFAIFHLNLAFSAVPEHERATVISACYHPLLDLVERGFPLGIEISGWGLQTVAALDPGWVARFGQLLGDGRCSLIGSGYQQIIGPLVPARVNRWNQELGLAVYDELLGVRPQLALVNEMAFARSNVACYKALGYQGLVLSRENAMAARLAYAGPWRVGSDGDALPVLFADALLFQKFQRLIHEDISAAEYWAYLKQWDFLGQALPIYCSDAEIFGYRPRRYHYESDQPRAQEWTRLGDLLAEIAARFDFVAPEQALVRGGPDAAGLVELTSCSAPITVKKQLKYAVSRWAISGRDDLYLNTLCHRLLGQLGEQPEREAKQALCRLFSSDLRTHIHEPRLRGALAELEAATGVAAETAPPAPRAQPAPRSAQLPPEVRLVYEGHLLQVRAPGLSFWVNLRRGLALVRVEFDGKPMIGTVPHGYFHAIELGADFYSGTTVVELPGQLKRITDLERAEVEVYAEGRRVFLETELPTPLGLVHKTLSFEVGGSALRLRYDFPGWARPLGTMRIGNITLLPEHWTEPLRLICHNGGERPEVFPLDQPCTHQAAVSSLISSTNGLGATTGWIRIEGGRQALELSWDPAQCAAFPMLWHQPSSPGHLTRLIFSLAETDDTSAEHGRLLPFELTLKGL